MKAAVISKSFGILCLVACFWGALLDAQTPLRWQNQFNSLEIGMSFQDVHKKLGAPELREANIDSEIWHYQKNTRYVEFQHQKVSGFGVGSPHLPAPGILPPSPTGSAQTSTPSTVLVLPTPLPSQGSKQKSIGESCNEDDNCITKNCHFHICSGKTNCSANVGDVCGNDRECCSGFCDFGKCAKKF